MMLLCVGRIRIAAITAFRSTPALSAKRDHSSTNAMLTAR
jgi:hypothetical protein